MRVQLLGTAGADGWPNPWCDCRSCRDLRSRGEVRGQTSALVGDDLLIDPGPEAPRAALRQGRDLLGVRHLLVTHAHPDHLGPALLMWRSWTSPTSTLDVAGPPAVVAECRRWVAEDAPIAWHELRAGDVVELGRYRVRALPADHSSDSVGPALLYDIESDGARMLWATDTRRLLPELLDATARRAYDAVFLEETNGDDVSAGTDHLDLTTWPLAVAELRRRDAVGATTTVVPIHLGHGNPPPAELSVRMAGWGAQVPADGDVFELGASASAPPKPARRVLVVGGARSGKSRWAESLVAAEPSVTYVATARPRPDDAEWEQRVAAHRHRRPAEWTTLETTDVADVLDRDGATLVDCLTLWLGAWLDAADLDERIDRLVGAVSRATGTVVLVSNEVGDGVVPATAGGRDFRDRLGVLNARIAAGCDEVWRLTAGIPVRLR